jgi:hypothetical protein
MRPPAKEPKSPPRDTGKDVVFHKYISKKSVVYDGYLVGKRCLMR